jgi:predicted transposase YbfD/YdcC
MSFLEEIENLEDIRADINIRYDLTDIIFLTMAGVLCGASGWKAIQMFGEGQIDWLRQYREFPNGIPTRHTIGRIIRSIDPDSLISCFVAWSNTLRDKSKREHITFDGKVIRGSKHGETINALQYMTAMVVENNLVIYQEETDCKTNEIPVMQSILQKLSIKNAIITADAMHCQKETAKIIHEAGADYILQIKDNQKCLLEETKAYFHKTRRESPSLIDNFNDVDGEHGRINERLYSVLKLSDWNSKAAEWTNAKAVVEVMRKRTIKGKESEEASYYLISLLSNTTEISGYIRNHWAIENSQHWVLDVTFREDECQIYAGDGARNLCTFRRALFNLIKENPLDDSVAGKMQKACWDGEFRAEILFA